MDGYRYLHQKRLIVLIFHISNSNIRDEIQSNGKRLLIHTISLILRSVRVFHQLNGVLTNEHVSLYYDIILLMDYTARPGHQRSDPFHHANALVIVRISVITVVCSVLVPNFLGKVKRVLQIHDSHCYRK